MLKFLLFLFAAAFLEANVLMTEPPEGFRLKAEVAAVLPFFADGRVLLLQRVASHPQGNLWTAPGGKILAGETPAVAAARELYEETGLQIAPSSLGRLGTFYVRYPNGDFLFHLFKISFVSNAPPISIQKEEHQSYCLCPLADVSQLPLTPGLDECFRLAVKE